MFLSLFALGCHHSMNVSMRTILKAPIPQQTCLIVTSNKMFLGGGRENKSKTPFPQAINPGKQLLNLEYKV